MNDPDKPEEEFYPFEAPEELEVVENDPTPEEEEELAAEALDLYEAEHGL